MSIGHVTPGLLSPTLTPNTLLRRYRDSGSDSTTSRWGISRVPDRTSPLDNANHSYRVHPCISYTQAQDAPPTFAWIFWYQITLKNVEISYPFKKHTPTFGVQFWDKKVRLKHGWVRYHNGGEERKLGAGRHVRQERKNFQKNEALPWDEKLVLSWGFS